MVGYTGETLEINSGAVIPIDGGEGFEIALVSGLIGTGIPACGGALVTDGGDGDIGGVGLGSISSLPWTGSATTIAAGASIGGATECSAVSVVCGLMFGCGDGFAEASNPVPVGGFSPFAWLDSTWGTATGLVSEFLPARSTDVDTLILFCLVVEEVLIGS